MNHEMATMYADSPLQRFSQRLEKLKDDDRSLVLVTNGILELMVEEMVRAKCRNAARILKANPTVPYSTKLLILNEIGILDDAAFRALDWFRQLRNRATQEPIFQITRADLAQVEEASLSTLQDLHTFCLVLLGGLWNRGLEVFLPAFAPNLARPNASAPGGVRHSWAQAA